MAIYLFEQDGGGPVACSGSTVTGNATYLGNGKVIIVNNSNAYLYTMESLTVTLEKIITADDLYGAAAIREELPGMRNFESGLFFATEKHQTQA